MSIKTEVTRVHSPYLGRHFWVAKADLADGRATLLPFYTRDGRKWADTAAGERAIRRGAAWQLHRDNIDALPMTDDEVANILAAAAAENAHSLLEDQP